MYKKRTFYLLVVVILLSCSDTIAQQKGVEKRAYRFINLAFKEILSPNKRLILEVLPKHSYSYDLDSMLNFEFLKEAQFSFAESPPTIRQLLSDDDLQYMKQQLSDWSTTKSLDKDKLKLISEQLVPKQTKPITSEEYKLAFYKIYPPLFTIKGDSCFLYMENYCGIECGSGQLNLYKKQKDGTWKVVYIVPTWVS